MTIGTTTGSEPKTALIFGVSGQDGAYLAQLLLGKGYTVHGTSRDREMSSFANLRRLGIFGRVVLHSAVLTDFRSVVEVISRVRPAEIYNLASQASVGLSFDQPVETLNSTINSTINILEAIRFLKLDTRFYNASSSECFGNTGSPADESTPFHPRSPYGVGKAAAYWAVANYREAYGLFACSGILFNHESPRRGETFVTKKITKAVADIHKGRRESIALGNLDARRDWGYAKDYVESMWLMLQQDKSDDYVVATNEAHSVREFVEKAFAVIGTTIRWEGTGTQERGIDQKTGKTRVTVDPRFFRPTEVEFLLGDASKATRVLGWKPRMSFPELVRTMVEFDLAYDDYNGAAG